jgi:UDP-N-acetylmuramoyl-tripeptide--D-alanyl-D-alanine ligase
MNKILPKIYNQFLLCKNIVIDTRKIEIDSMFMAIKGVNFDANEFTSKALELGAKYVVIDNKNFFIDDRTILVDDSLKFLQELATYHRQQINIPIIALTGSNGKTTSKELIYSVLKEKYNCKATFGNLNNHIGVPLTLLSFDKNTEIGIVEMGANHQKEIEFLCEIAQPDYGYITNFGKAHLEGFGGIDGVIKGKSEMYNYMFDNQKNVFVNLEDRIQNEKTKNYDHKITFGNENLNPDVIIKSISCNPFVKIEIKNIIIQSNLIGIYNASNICAAITIGLHFKLSLEEIKKGIESYIPENNRSQIIKKDNKEIILDAYNANPSSMLEAVKNFNILNYNSKLMILGDMFELGVESEKEHLFLINYINNLEIDTYFVGNHFFNTKIESSKLYFFKDYHQLVVFFSNNNIKSQFLLIKGSRGMALERILNIL